MKQRDLAPILAAHYQHQNPHRPTKHSPFSEESLAVAAWALAQLEMIWERLGLEPKVMPLIPPPAPAYEGYTPQPSVKPSAKHRGGE